MLKIVAGGSAICGLSKAQKSMLGFFSRRQWPTKTHRSEGHQQLAEARFLIHMPVLLWVPIQT